MTRHKLRLPGVSRAERAMPGPSRHRLELPRPSRHMMSNVPPLPIETVIVTALFSAGGTLTAGAITYSRVAAFGGGGALSASTRPVQYATPQFGGEGTLDPEIEIVPVVVRAMVLGGSGASTMGVVTPVDDVDFTGAGSLSASAVVAFVRAAAFGGGGSLSASAAERQLRAAAFGGGGALSMPGIIPVQYAQAAMSGGGALSMVVREIEAALAGFAGGGALTMIARPSFSRAAALSGGGALTATAVGFTLASGGAIKSAGQTLSNTSTPVQVVDMAVDPAYPATVLSSNGIVVSGGGTATITLRLTSSTTNVSNWGVHIRKNGVQIGPEYTPGATVTDPFGGSFTASVANGDVLTMWAWTTATTSNRRLIDPTTTWFKLTP